MCLLARLTGKQEVIPAQKRSSQVFHSPQGLSWAFKMLFLGRKSIDNR